MRTKLLITASVGALAVLLGAFGAHSLKATLSTEALESFETGVRYQFIHVLALLVALNTSLLDERSKNLVFMFFMVGILCFSGSIYAITFGVPASFIWFITPLGGILFAAGWIRMGIGYFRFR